jgi:hypothetical protein
MGRFADAKTSFGLALAERTQRADVVRKILSPMRRCPSGCYQKPRFWQNEPKRADAVRKILSPIRRCLQVVTTSPAVVQFGQGVCMRGTQLLPIALRSCADAKRHFGGTKPNYVELIRNRAGRRSCGDFEQAKAITLSRDDAGIQLFGRTKPTGTGQKGSLRSVRQKTGTAGLGSK